MVGITTIGVGLGVTPCVIETWCSHYLNRKSRKQKPTAHISYDVGLNLIRQFLTYAANQRVEDLQIFTSQWVPSPTWVRVEGVDVPDSCLVEAATSLQKQLGPEGVQLVGGKIWWQWRHPEIPLRAEWIEMKKDYTERKRKGVTCQRCMFYVHGGAYFFGSVDEHRYLMQRHARKLQARLLAPRYRLAPEFPFPCGLHDCLAAYLYLLTVQQPETIVLAGDSAGAGMLVSLLVILRDQGIPMPAGAVLISPWVDLTHSFPSVAGINALDYVPPHGFHHRPSSSWPPPNSDELQMLDETIVDTSNGERLSVKDLRKRTMRDAENGDNPSQGSTPAASTVNAVGANAAGALQQHTSIKPEQNESLCTVLDGKPVELKDQIQMYTTNTLLSHPLVSPVLQSSLGGLPPLCVIVGGGEMLRDEQIYLAHKAANPWSYPAPHLSADGGEVHSDRLRYHPTRVHLQVWDDLCHVALTLSFTRPAKYQFRSVAQFSAWALAHAQRSEIRILDDDEVSVISNASSEEEGSDSGSVGTTFEDLQKDDQDGPLQLQTRIPRPPTGKRPKTPAYIGRAGDPLPPFKGHMIRQRVTRHGQIYDLEVPAELPGCQVKPSDIGTVKPGPVRKWLHAQRTMSERFADERRSVQSKRLAEMRECAGGRGAVFADGSSGDDREITRILERPPPTAWAGRSKEQLKKLLKSNAKKRTSHGLAMWSGWGSHHDEEAIEKEEEKVKNKEDVTMSITKVRTKNANAALSQLPSSSTTQGPAEMSSAVKSVPAKQAQTGESAEPSSIAPLSATEGLQDIHSSDHVPLEPTTSRSNRPSAIPHTTLPFKLASPTPTHNDAAASTLTLTNASGIVPNDDARSITTTTAARSHTSPTNYNTSPKQTHTQTPEPPESNRIHEETPSRPFTPSSFSSAEDTHDPHRPAPIIVTGEAVAMPLRTPESARREHARASSKVMKVNGDRSSKEAEGDAVDKWASGVTSRTYPSDFSNVSAGTGVRHASGEAGGSRSEELPGASGQEVAGGGNDEHEDWADGVLREMGRKSLEVEMGERVMQQGVLGGSRERPEQTRFFTASND